MCSRTWCSQAALRVVSSQSNASIVKLWNKVTGSRRDKGTNEWGKGSLVRYHFCDSVRVRQKQRGRMLNPDLRLGSSSLSPYVYMSALFLWSHAQGGRLKCSYWKYCVALLFSQIIIIFPFPGWSATEKTMGCKNLDKQYICSWLTLPFDSVQMKKYILTDKNAADMSLMKNITTWNIRFRVSN